MGLHLANGEQDADVFGAVRDRVERRQDLEVVAAIDWEVGVGEVVTSLGLDDAGLVLEVAHAVCDGAHALVVTVEEGVKEQRDFVGALLDLLAKRL